MTAPTASTILDRLQRAWERHFLNDRDIQALRLVLAEEGWKEAAVETIDASLNFALAYLVPSRLQAEAEAPTAPTAAPLPLPDARIRDCANALDQLFRQRHTTRDVEAELRALLREAAALAQLPPREPDQGMHEAAQNVVMTASVMGEPPLLDDLWRAMHDSWTKRHAAPTGIPRPEAEDARDSPETLEAVFDARSIARKYIRFYLSQTNPIGGRDEATKDYAAMQEQTPSTSEGATPRSR